MRQPWREPVASIVAHRALFSCGAKGIGDALRCPLVIGRKGDADMAVVEDGVVLAIGSEEHPSELQSLMRISYAAFCLTKKKEHTKELQYTIHTAKAVL